MEIRATNNLTNLSITPSTSSESTSESRSNAFGIGSANQPEVQLSPQARILQQNEQTQTERREAFDQQRQNNQNEDDEQPAANSNSEFVRVSSSVGSAQSNNLSTEKATEIYRSIQELL